VDLGGFKWVGFSTWKVGRIPSGAQREALLAEAEFVQRVHVSRLE